MRQKTNHQNLQIYILTKMIKGNIKMNLLLQEDEEDPKVGPVVIELCKKYGLLGTS